MSETGQPSTPNWFAEALDRFERPLLRYAARLTGDLDLAREAVQETFLRLCRHDGAELNGRLSPWLFAVCRTRAFDIRRKEGRMATASDIEVQSCESRPCDPSAALERREESSRVLSAVARLPGNQQEVVLLRFQSELSYKDIALVTGLSVSNVGFLIHTAMKAIRAGLGVE